MEDFVGRQISPSSFISCIKSLENLYNSLIACRVLLTTVGFSRRCVDLNVEVHRTVSFFQQNSSFRKNSTICPHDNFSFADRGAGGGNMDNSSWGNRNAVLSRPPEAVAREFDSSRPENRRPVVTYHVLGADADLVPQNSWNRVERFQPSLWAFFRWVGCKYFQHAYPPSTVMFSVLAAPMRTTKRCLH